MKHGFRLRIRVSQRDLSVLSCVKREVVNKELADWNVRGYIEFDSPHLVIHDKRGGRLARVMPRSDRCYLEWLDSGKKERNVQNADHFNPARDLSRANVVPTASIAST